MNFIYLLSVVSTMLTNPATAVGQNNIKNKETQKFHVKGICEESKEIIEKVGSQPRISKVDYDSVTQTATITYNKSKTNSQEILKKIALAGFDNSEYLAPDEAYLKLAKECQYPREKTMKLNHQSIDHSAPDQTKNQANQNQLSMVYDAYFMLKDAFVKADEIEISKQISVFSKSISIVDMGKLSHETHLVWMDVLKVLETTSNQLSQETNIDKQRLIFAKLAEPMAKVAQKAALGYTIYYQTCPMFNGGSNWLSKDENIRNPFYGNKMLTCGSTIKIIKK